MLEVYMLGVLIAIIKLTSMASIVPGIALYSFVALMITSTAASLALDPELVWKKLEEKPCHVL